MLTSERSLSSATTLTYSSLTPTTSLPADLTTWRPSHVRTWARALNLPQTFQNHIVDAQLSGTEVVELTEKDVGRILGDGLSDEDKVEEERVRVVLAIRCLQYGGPHMQLFLHAHQSQLQQSFAAQVETYHASLKNSLALFFQRVIRSLRDLGLGISSGPIREERGDYGDVPTLPSTSESPSSDTTSPASFPATSQNQAIHPPPERFAQDTRRYSEDSQSQSSVHSTVRHSRHRSSARPAPDIPKGVFGVGDSFVQGFMAGALVTWMMLRWGGGRRRF
ncbi:hypothetical protein DFS34DRAFT_599698 [Phlyctochytrium arcticum]|nr:hypothetical protein DFS34DRAFT_599698 [Phlyctochytrium arcticum]